jgi:hypothetical protein
VQYYLTINKDPGSIAESAIRIIMDKEMATSTGEEGKRRAIALFDEKRVVRKQLRIYDQIYVESLGHRNR